VPSSRPQLAASLWLPRSSAAQFRQSGEHHSRLRVVSMLDDNVDYTSYETGTPKIGSVSCRARLATDRELLRPGCSTCNSSIVVSPLTNCWTSGVCAGKLCTRAGDCKRRRLDDLGSAGSVRLRSVCLRLPRWRELLSTVYLAVDRRGRLLLMVNSTGEVVVGGDLGRSWVLAVGVIWANPS